MNEHAIPTPAYEKLPGWELYCSEMETEKQQTIEEGKDIREFEGLFDAIAAMPCCGEKVRLADILYEKIVKAPQRADYPYNEPSELDAIRALRPAGAGEKKPLPALDVLRDKIAGAWYGRIAGCSLGKPVEGIRTNEFEPFLKETGNWPMHRFIRSSDLTDEMKDKYAYPLHVHAQWMIDRISGAPADDDTNYTVLAQILIERFGRDFTPENVMQLWLEMQPKKAYCTAERVAFVNAMKGYLPPDTARFENPYREWIGAQIRGDYFGYVNPGDPEAAADMAWRDASISHIKNGIYGEMFIAAMLAEAAVTTNGDIESVIETGLKEIPAGSRLYEAVRGVIDGFHAGVSQEEAFRRIHEKWNEYTGYGWCHTISNAMIVAAALLYGGGDYGKSVCMAVQTGFDTDCNGATVGSVIGMLRGLSALPEEWTKPFNDTLHTSLFGFTLSTISEMAEKTLKHIPGLG